MDSRWRRLATDEDHVLAIKISCMFVLAALSAVFSGLNLGLMCLDANQLMLLDKAAVEKATFRNAPK